VFDYILPIYFMSLYNTMGMSHLKVRVLWLNKYGKIPDKNYKLYYITDRCYNK